MHTHLHHCYLKSRQQKEKEGGEKTSNEAEERENMMKAGGGLLPAIMEGGGCVDIYVLGGKESVTGCESQSVVVVLVWSVAFVSSFSP